MIEHAHLVSGARDVLVVDDNPNNLVAIEAALRPLTDRLTKAQSGQSALRHLLERDFALILLDVQMPSMNGLETARLIRSRERTRHLPIIFVTAFDTDEAEVLDAYKLGAVDFLFKPIVPEILHAKASVFVALHHRTAEVARQAHLLREHERREHERKLAEARRLWEEEALRRRVEEERQNSRRKDEFLATLAHELRNPLAPLVTGLEILRRSTETDPAILRTRASMERQLGQLCRLVDDLLDISRITSGKITLRPKRIDGRDVVREAVASCQELVEARRQVLVEHLPEAPLWVRGDPARLTQIATNLLHNASRYAHVNGRIEISCSREGEELVLRVADDGKGIREDLLDRVFDIFVQDAPGEGLGLGLTLVKRLVDLHGGTVSAASPGEGLGSEFTVRLPAGTADAPADRMEEPGNGHAAPPGPIDAPLRIVLVEDNDDIRTSLTDLLQILGHEVHSAADGASGLELLLREHPDVALVDIGLPELDGYDVANRVRAAVPEGGPRLVAMSGYGQTADRLRAERAGFHDYLIKPASFDALTRVLRQA